jgi:hypothetical protein
MPAYFATLPQIIMVDPAGNQTLATNIMARASIIPSLVDNPQLYYLYDSQETDTPELITTKYYNDPYRYWILMYGNQRMDPQWDFALSNEIFLAYLDAKYGSDAANNSMTVIAYTQSTVYQYQITITTTDSTTGTITTNIYPTTSSTYANTASSTVVSPPFIDGSFVTVVTSKQTLSIYDYENNLNESKRSLKMIDKKYASAMETTLQTLMGT